MTYFKDCKTAEEIKNRFKELAKQLHPDCGGDAEQFKAMKAEYDEIIKTGVNFTADDKENAESMAAFADILEKIIHLDGINIEIVGSWLWITGNTYPVRAELKEAGFKFGSKKKAWYFHFGEYHGRKNNNSLDDIRIKYGSQTIKGRPIMAIA